MVSDLLSYLEGQLFGIKGSVNKLRKYLLWYLRRIEQAPLDAKVVYLILKTNANFMKTEVYSNVRALYSYLLDIFEEGRASGEMKPDLNPLFARDIFVGTVDHIITRWLLKDMTYPLFDNLEAIFGLMVDGFRDKDTGEPAQTVQRAETPGESPGAEFKQETPPPAERDFA